MILSWRDIKNPEAGGAEVLTFEVAKEWAAGGHKVTLITADYKGGPSHERLQGIEIIRKGSLWSVWFWAYRVYKKNFAGKVDIVIDQINTIPFFTPFYVREKKLLLIHQLARETFWYNTSFPFSLIGFLLEPLYLRLYKHVRTVTISPSTCQDLLNLGFRKRNIQIIPLGIDFKALHRLPKKEKELTLIYLGRLKKAKRIEHIIESFYLTKKQIPKARLWIVGRGPKDYLRFLKGLVRKKRLTKSVIFWNFVGFEQKITLLKKAHLLILSSVREGWGIAVNEAAALGTPALAYEVPGLRDSILNPQTGILCASQAPEKLSEKIIEVWQNPPLRIFLARNALKSARGRSWQKTAMSFEKILKNLLAYS